MRRSFAAVVIALSLSVTVLSASTSVADERTPLGTAAERQATRTSADRVLARAVEAVEGTDPDPTRSVTLALRDLSLALPDLDATERKRADALLARPSNGPNDEFGDGYTVPRRRSARRRSASTGSTAPPTHRRARSGSTRTSRS